MKQPKKKQRPKHDFRKTATGFVLNGKHVTVEYKSRRTELASQAAR